MALTDEQIQDIQGQTKKASATKQPGDPLQAGDQQYVVVATTGKDSTTQGISVAPVVDGKPDYSQTAVVVAGTQTPFEGVGYDSFFSGDMPNSIGNAGKSYNGITPQTKDIEKLYKDTEKNLPKGGEITNMSGHSQAVTDLNESLTLCYPIRELTLGSFVK